MNNLQLIEIRENNKSKSKVLLPKVLIKCTNEDEDINKLIEIERLSKELMFYGFVYFLEYGERFKIGSTYLPYTRLRQLQNQGRNYGDLIIGNYYLLPPHTNYRENEVIFKNHFRNKRYKGELFDITLLDIAKAVRYMDYDLENNAEELENKCNQTSNFFIEVLSRRYY